MGHKVLVGGTAYEITGGRTLIDGTGFEISSGKTLIAGTAYTIPFKPAPIIIYAPGIAALQAGTIKAQVNTTISTSKIYCSCGSTSQAYIIIDVSGLDLSKYTHLYVEAKSNGDSTGYIQLTKSDSSMIGTTQYLTTTTTIYDFTWGSNALARIVLAAVTGDYHNATFYNVWFE